MTKTKLSVLLITALFGGFVFSFSGDALAKDDESLTKQEAIDKFIADNLVDTGKKAGDVVKSSQSLKELVNDYKKKLDSLFNDFNEKMGNFEKDYSCKGNNWQRLKEWVSQKVFSPEGVYSFVNETINAAHYCKKSDDNYNQRFQELLDIATKLENVRQQWKAADKINNGALYQYVFCAQYKQDEKGNKTSECATYGYYDFIVNSEDHTITSLSGVQQGCVPLPFKLAEAKSCLFCPLFETIYEVVQTASSTSYAKFGSSLATLLLIGLSIWIAFMVLQNVGSMTKQDAPKFLTELFKNSFKVIIIFFLLRNSTLVYEFIIGPLLKAGFELALSFLSKTPKDMGCGVTNISSNIDGVMPVYVYSHLMCFLKTAQLELAESQAVGASLLCVSRHAAKGNLGAIAKALPDFSMMFQGGLIWIISFMMSIAFGFYLIDATVQLGLFGVILPFLLLCWPFKITHGYFTTGIKVFMNSWFIYVFMGIVVNINLQLIGQSLSGGKGGLAEIESKINANDVRGLQDILDIGFSGFLILIACCVMSIKLMQKVEQIAAKFGGGGGLGLNIGAQIGGTGVNAAKGVAIAGGQFVAHNAVNGASAVANAKIFGKDGEEKSLADGYRSAKAAVGRGATKIARGAGKVAGKAIALPVTAVAAGVKALKGHRKP